VYMLLSRHQHRDSVNSAYDKVPSALTVTLASDPCLTCLLNIIHFRFSVFTVKAEEVLRYRVRTCV
jgi:hypothetical protein